MKIVPRQMFREPLFAETKYAFTVYYTNGKTLRVPPTTYQAYRYWQNLARTTSTISRIGAVQAVSTTEREIQEVNRARATRNQPPVRKIVVSTRREGNYLINRWSDGTTTRHYSPRPPTTTTPRTTPTPPAYTPPPTQNLPNTELARDIATEINEQTGAGDNAEETVEQAREDLSGVLASIKEIWANIEEKKRNYEADKKFAGDQRVKLGQAIDDAWSGIQSNTDWLTELQAQLNKLNERVSTQLKELGKSVVDVSEALKAMQLAQEAKQAAENINKAVGGGALGTISDFFSKPTNILLVAGGLVLLLVLVKR